MHLIYSETNQPVQMGDVANTFRDEPVTVVGWEEPRHAGSTGRVIVKSTDASKWQNSFYPSVCNMEWVGDTNY